MLRCLNVARFYELLCLIVCIESATRSGVEDFETMDVDEMNPSTGPGPQKCEVFLCIAFVYRCFVSDVSLIANAFIIWYLCVTQPSG